MHIGLLSRPLECLGKVENAACAVNNLAKNEIRNTCEGIRDIGFKVNDLIGEVTHVDPSEIDWAQTENNLGGAAGTGGGTRGR